MYDDMVINAEKLTIGNTPMIIRFENRKIWNFKVTMILFVTQ